MNRHVEQDGPDMVEFGDTPGDQRIGRDCEDVVIGQVELHDTVHIGPGTVFPTIVIDVELDD
jgi:hypothetical protein